MSQCRPAESRQQTKPNTLPTPFVYHRHQPFSKLRPYGGSEGAVQAARGENLSFDRNDPRCEAKKKIRLFDDHTHDEPTVLVFNELPPQNLLNFADALCAAEGGARMIGLRQLHAQRVRIFGLDIEEHYARIVEALKSLGTATDNHAWQKAKEYKDESDRRRRAKIDARGAAARAEWQLHLPVTGDSLRRGIRLRPSKGLRRPRDALLTEEDLYLDDACPTPLQYFICQNGKSHPVSYQCGHSNCYVCIRVSLETSWLCSQCKQLITARPSPHDEEKAVIEKENPGWDESRVAYWWDGVVFPRRSILLSWEE
ncbi:hypothetical protein B0H19DRAFT_1078995 [Mycena capillaripes]|nr:hypothetical protein B0H19DRAFT_1078995 [Mycena capillaripes]